MRVLQILHTDERGGIETLSAMIEHGLTERGFAVDTIYLFPAVDLGPIRKLLGVVRCAVKLLRDDHDAVMAYQATASVLTGICGFLRGCRHRIVHQTAIPSETAWPIRLADKIVGTLGLYTANIANTVYTRLQFQDYPERYRRAMVLILHGLNVPRATRSRASLRALYALPPEDLLILNVGRLTAQKNQSVLIEALVDLKNASLVIAGHGGDMAQLRAEAERLGVSDRLHLLGAVAPAEVADLYAACDVFAFPSTWETFGLAAVEAAIAGMPMVVADLAVLREVLASKTSPVAFVPCHDAVEWTRALAEALQASATTQSRAQFQAELAQRYAVETMVEQYVALLSNQPAAMGVPA